jgi:hypothetical protein
VTGQAIAVLEGYEFGISSAAFSLDGREVVTVSDDMATQTWRLFATTQALVDEAKKQAPRCLSRKERSSAFLDPEPPVWCIEMEKWPYRAQDWKDWLQFKRAYANPPLPDTDAWRLWLRRTERRAASPSMRLIDALRALWRSTIGS